MNKRVVGAVAGGVLALSFIGSLGNDEPEPQAQPAATTQAPEPEPETSATTEAPQPVETEAPEPIEAETRPGDPAVYAQIEASTDCADLQETFDRAAGNNERAETGSEAFDYTLGYMEAADDRMREVGCY